MIDRPTLIDTNIIVDVIRLDPVWGEWSTKMLFAQAKPVVNSMVFAELCFSSASAQEVGASLTQLSVTYRDLSLEALHLASQAYKAYKQRGGTKLAPLPDFFIGAHAQAEGWPLLTRDPQRYRSYFPKIAIISPEATT